MLKAWTASKTTSENSSVTLSNSRAEFLFNIYLHVIDLVVHSQATRSSNQRAYRSEFDVRACLSMDFLGLAWLSGWMSLGGHRQSTKLFLVETEIWRCLHT